MKININQSQNFGVEFHNCDIIKDKLPGIPEDPEYLNLIPTYSRPDNSLIDAVLVIYVLAMTLHGPALFWISRKRTQRISGPKLESRLGNFGDEDFRDIQNDDSQNSKQNPLLWVAEKLKATAVTRDDHLPNCA